MGGPAANSNDSSRHHHPPPRQEEKEKQKKRSRSNRQKDDSQAGKQPRRFSVGEHTPEYWEALSQAYRARGAPSRPSSSSVGGVVSDHHHHHPQGREDPPPPPLNLETTRYAAERRNAHLDHALVCAAAEQVSASSSSSASATARPRPRPSPPPRPPPPPPPPQSGSSSSSSSSGSSSTAAAAAVERPISIVSPRPIRPFGADPTPIEEAARRDEARVDEEVRRGLEEKQKTTSRIPRRRRRVSSPPLSLFGFEGPRPDGPPPPRCGYYLSDDDCLVMCTPDRCFHAHARRQRGRSSWRVPSFCPSNKKRSVSESSSFVCASAAAAERARRHKK